MTVPLWLIVIGNAFLLTANLLIRRNSKYAHWALFWIGVTLGGVGIVTYLLGW